MGRKTPLTVTSTGKAVKKNPKPKKAKLETSAKQVRKLEGVGVDRIRDPEHGAPSSAAVVSAEQKETRLKSHESDENVCSSQLENSNERTVGNRRASSPPMSRCIAPGTSTIPRDGSTPRSNGTTGVGVGVGINIAKNRKVPGKRKAYDGMQTATQDQVGVERVQSLPFEEDHDARLKTALKFVKAKHREMFGKGRPIVGKYIAALAKLGLKRFVDCSSSGGSGTCDGQEKSPPGDDEEGTVAVTVRAITAAAKEKHSCKVTLSQFTKLFGQEVAAQFKSKEGPDTLLHRALEAEQAGDLAAAEAEYTKCLEAHPTCGTAHLKMAQILRSRGISLKRAVHDVESHLRQALECATRTAGRREEEADDLARTAAERLSLLLCQEGRDDEAAEILKGHGFRYRLSSQVLSYPFPGTRAFVRAQQRSMAAEQGRREGSSTSADDGGDLSGHGAVEASSGYVAAFDKALPSEMLRHLQEGFGEDSPFWSEHGYNSETGTPGYFSYVHNLREPAKTSLDQVIDRLRRLAEPVFPAVKKAKYVEWWAHRRPHSSGHQMHFDSDNEGMGGVRNPIVSLVVYLSSRVGGPTLVTDQQLTSKRLASRGWIVHPAENRVCIFDGKLLHGVIPGRGIPPLDGRVQATQSAAPGEGKGSRRKKRRRRMGFDRDTGDDPSARAGLRVTWMVAFWEDIRARPRSVWLKGSTTPSGAGAAQPFPVDLCDASKLGKSEAAEGRATWPVLFRKKPDGWATGTASGKSRAVVPRAVPYVWQDVDAGQNDRDRIGVSGLKQLPEYDACFQGF